MSFKNVIIIIIIANLVALCTRHYNGGASSQMLNASPAPQFTWVDLDGKSHSLKELKGHVVVLHFWASWCGPCRREFPELLKAAKALGPDVIFLAISADDTLDAAKRFVTKEEQATGITNLENLKYGFDADKKVIFDAFQTAVLPESIVLDQNQNMRRKFAGSVLWQNPQVSQYLKGVTPQEPAKKP